MSLDATLQIAQQQLSRRDFLRRSAGAVASAATLGLAPLALASNHEILDIPQPMKDLGFELAKEDNLTVLLTPALENRSFRPDNKYSRGSGHFTDIRYNPQTNSVHVRTSHGEEAVMEVWKQRGVIQYQSKLRGIDEKATWTYEPDKFVRRWVQDNELYDIPSSIEYDTKSDTLLVRKDGVGEIYREKVQLPTGINIEVLLGRYLKISDKLGKKFAQSSLFGRVASDYILVNLNPFGIRDNKAHFGYTIGNMSSSFSSLQEFIDRILLESIYKQEFNEKSGRIHIGNKQLTVRGPNRNGDYELTSGKSSLIYNPKNGFVSLGREWNTSGAQSTILRGSIPDGFFEVKDDYGHGKYRIWRININFGNTNPNQSYSPVLVEDRLKSN
ncbi:MAG: twin-arginine translocation signal domain-containing protein [Nanoarchaeota archaeon]